MTPWYKSLDFWMGFSAVSFAANSFAGLLAAFLLNSAYLWWAVSSMVALALVRIEQLHMKMQPQEEIPELQEEVPARYVLHAHTALDNVDA